MLIPVLLFVTHQHIYFSWMMLISHIIQVLLFIIHQLIFIFYVVSSTHFFLPLWMVDATFIFILLFISSYFRSVWHPFSCFIIRFILCHLSKAYTCSIMFIPHCKYFFLSSCTRNLAHSVVKTHSQSLLHRKCTCTRPVRQMPFGITSLKIDDKS